MNQTSSLRKPINQKNIVLIIISLSSFISAFSGSSIIVAAPIMGAELQMDAATLSWFVTIFILATALLQIPFGKIADLYGRKKIYFIGMLIFTSSTLALGFANSVNLLLAFRFGQGIGAALVFATGTAILTSVFPANEKGKAFGYNIGAVYFGLTIGPSLGGVLTQHLGWRSIFYITASLALMVALLIVWKLKGEWTSEIKEPFDYIGSLIYVSTLFLLLYGFKVLPKYPGYIMIGGSIICAGTFVWWERRIDNPILELRLFKKNKFFTFANLSAFAFYASTSAVSFLLSLYLQSVKGFTPQQTGLILLARPIVQAILSPIGGRLSDFIEHRTITTIGVGIGFVSLLLLTFLNENSHLSLIIASLALGGLGFGLFSSPNANSIMSSVSKRFFGVASALIGTMRTIGQTLSLSIVTLIFAVLIGDTSSETPEYAAQLLESSKIAFIIFTSLCTIAVVFSFLRGKMDQLKELDKSEVGH